jgi:hypothetical protein
MPKYVIISEGSEGSCILCTTPWESPLSNPAIYWDVLEIPVKPSDRVIVFASEIEAFRVKLKAEKLDSPFRDSRWPCRIAPWGTVSGAPGDAEASTVGGVTGAEARTCASFDSFPPEAQIYAALQVLVSEIINKCQRDRDGKFVGGRFDPYLIEHCEDAMAAYRESLCESDAAKRKREDSQGAG